MNHQSLSSFLWSVADLLRGDYKQSEYGRVILPFTVLRRLDCVLADTKDAALAEFTARTAARLNPRPFLLRVTGRGFYNVSPLDLKRLMGDQDHIAANLEAYIHGFSPEVRDIFERFDFATQVDRLQRCGLLYQVTERFAAIDLHPDLVDNQQMGLVFEGLIRRFAEISNETAGEHFTPRDAIRLMVNLLFIKDDDILARPGVVRSLYDPAAGTGGMISTGEEYLAELYPEARLALDAAGKEVDRRVLMPGETPPTPPDAGAGGEPGRARVRVLPLSRILRTQDFGYRTITVERPLRDEAGEIVAGQKGARKDAPQPDPKRRDTENVPLTEDVAAYFAREVRPHAPDAWIDHSKTTVGYEIPCNRHFYVFDPPRPLAAIGADLARVTERIKARLGGLSG